MNALRNDQVTLLALLQLGGSSSAVDTEDIAVAADKLAPGRFRWHKYPEHIDLGLVRNGLQDARKRSLTAGGALKGWILTENGKHEADAFAALTLGDAARERLSLAEKGWKTRERARLMHEPSFIRALKGGVFVLTEREILKLFRIDEYVPADKRTARLKQFSSAFSDDGDFGPTIRAMERRMLT